MTHSEDGELDILAMIAAQERAQNLSEIGRKSGTMKEVSERIDLNNECG